MKKWNFLIAVISIIWMYSTSALAKERLLFAVDLIRHGDRMPVHNIPTSPDFSKEVLGELTPVGMNQEFQLGEKVHKIYVTENHLLPEHYQPDVMYVRSTDMNRTLMSAESFLFGLYPPTSFQNARTLPAAFQPIPIHTLPKKEDHLLVVKTTENKILMAGHYLSDYYLWWKKTRPLEEKISQWSEITGMHLQDPRQFCDLEDNLYIRQLHHVPLPKGISEKDAAEIIALGRWAILEEFKSKEISYPTGHAFLEEVSHYLKQASQENTPLKYVLFSAHDSTIMAVMTTLGVPLDEMPKYASRLNFSLYEEKNQYIVKISYNDKPVTIPACAKTVCSLTEFEKFSHG